MGRAGRISASAGRFAALFSLALAGWFWQIGAAPSQAATCATGSFDGSFATAAVDETIGAGGEADCYTLTGLTTGDWVSVAFVTSAAVEAGPIWSLRDGNGNPICQSSSGGQCEITGAKGWTLNVYDSDSSPEAGTFSYSLAFRRLTEPQGCSSSLGDPPGWSFAAPRVDGSISGPAAARCYTFTRESGEADGNYWFRAVRSAGTLNPRWTVYGPSGSVECSGFAEGIEQRCKLPAFGKFALVVSDYGESQPGSFFITAKRLDSPGGCGASPSVAFGSSPTSGSISTGGEADCYSLAGVSAEDSVSVSLVAGAGSNASPRWSLVDGNGNPICDSNGNGVGGTCELSGEPGWSLLVYDAGGGGTFSYSLAVRRLTSPQGCSSLGAPGAWSFTAPRIDGTIGKTLDAHCYTFERELGEADADYWFRAVRTAGATLPHWAVYGPSGSRECEGGENTPTAHCRLLASGQFAFVVSDTSGEKTGSFFATAKRLSAPSGCSAAPGPAFGGSPLEGAIASSGEIDCYALQEVAVGDTISVGLVSPAGSNPSPRWELIDGNGNSICRSSDIGLIASCSLSGATGWSLLVFDEGAGSYSYSLAARQLTKPKGCVALDTPATWSFTAPRLNGTIAGDLDARCYTFSRSIEEPDGTYWFRVLRSSGALNLRWDLYGPDGARECGGFEEGPETPCRLKGAGQYVLVVSDFGGEHGGGFLFEPKRLSQPAGCAPLPDIASGFGPLLGNLSTGGEVDCYTLPATEGDQLSFQVSGAADRYAVLAPDGGARCLYYYSTCTFADDGPFTLLVYASGTASGTYHLKAQCENPPCGLTETAIASATPNKLGQSQFVTTLIRGHDLDLLEEVTLSRGGQEIHGEIQEPSKDARAVDVRFDLREAAVGAWSLTGKFTDGSTRTLAGGVSVEAAHEGDLSVETVGRGAFRVGAQAPLSVVVHNSGNVDQVAVPVVLRGLPVGATITPQFESYAPSGAPGGEISFAKRQYDQASEALTEEGEIVAPFLIGRVPAGGSVSMDFTVSVPGMATFKVNAMVGHCLGAATASGSAATAQRTKGSSGEDGEVVNCAGATAKEIAGLVLDGVPGGSCIGVASDLLIDAAVSANGGEGFWSWSHAIGWLADGAWCLGEVVAPESKIIKTTLDVASHASLAVNGVGAAGTCLYFPDQAGLQMQAVIAIDPNDIEGPAGVGPQRYVQANAPLTYKVLFENVATASAAAESVEIDDHLDNQTFDPSSVLFTGIRFGHTVYDLPYPSPTLDETFDLRPEANAQVHVTASVSGEDLKAELVAIDPDTLTTPEDPLVGVLPPNEQPPEGEGELIYTVMPQPLPSGATIANSASIRFDQNEPQLTPTWTNVVDKQAPTATVSAEATPQPRTAHVTWGGADDAAGIVLWRLEVSEDGGPFEFWRTATSPESSDFEATEDGSYAFRAIAYDGAGNVGQSSLAGVSLSATNTLSVSRTGTGSGSVTSVPAGIQCGTSCKSSFARGDEVTLTASPDPGSAFAGWSGGGCSGSGSCTVSLTADAAVTARFDAVDKGGSPSGSSAKSSADPYGECIAAARRAFQLALRAAKRHPSGRASAIRKARRRHRTSVSRCKARFGS